MALCDRLEAQHQERQTQHKALASAALARFADAPTPANLDYLFHNSYSVTPTDLCKSILTLAVQGKLVPQDPNDIDPESALVELQLERIRRAKAGKLRAAKVPAKTSLDDSLPYLPESWRTVSFDHLAVAHNNALKAGPFGSALKKEFYVEKGYKIYGQEQVIAGDPFIGDYYIDDMKFSELESCAVSTGDILISLVGTIGKILVLPEGIEPGIINPRLIKLSLEPFLVYPMFIKVLIGSPYAVDFFEENSHGGTMNILNLSILRDLPVPLPPLAEQRRIVAKIDQLMTLVDQLETQLATSQVKAKELLDAVIHKLLNPSAEIIAFPQSFDRQANRIVVACYILQHMAANPGFGRTVAAKLLYLAEAHIGLPLDGSPLRMAAGPLDPWIYSFEEQGVHEGWFGIEKHIIRNKRKKIQYIPKLGLATKAAEAITVLADQKTEFDRLLNLFSSRSTKEAEIIATLFAAWNDLLLDELSPTDEVIIREVRESWHRNKAHLTLTCLQRWLDWMRQNQLLPKGQGPRTKQPNGFKKPMCHAEKLQ